MPDVPYLVECAKVDPHSLAAFRDPALAAIAQELLRIETPDTRRSDELDFSDQDVWTLKLALEAAFGAGRLAGTGGHQSRPA